VKIVRHIGKQLHFAYEQNRSSFVCTDAEYMKYGGKKANFIWAACFRRKRIL